MPEALRAAETAGGTQIELGLNAAIVSVRDQQPQILVVRPGDAGSGEWDALPFGPFSPREHRTLEIGLRAWVKRQTGLDLGYVEQLYTFGDRGRHAEPGDTRLAHSLGRLSRADPRRRRRAARLALVALVRLFPLGGLAARQARDPHERDRAAAEGMGRARAVARRAGAAAAPRRAAESGLRHRRRLRRGEGARALRAAL